MVLKKVSEKQRNKKTQHKSGVTLALVLEQRRKRHTQVLPHAEELIRHHHSHIAVSERDKIDNCLMEQNLARQ